MNPFGLGGQRSRSQWTYVEINHDERMNPIDFGGQRSKVKVTMDIYGGNKLVNTIETELLCIS